jgi:vitamin B12/bleomycin/antimicrobial peptide transport system ATP-binding/permease protein
MDWNTQLLASALWVLKTYVITWVVLVPTCLALVYGTEWGRQFWRLSGAYFSPRRSLRPLAALALVLLLTLCGVRLNVLFSIWYNGMYNSLQQLNAKAFWFSMGIFSILATVHVARALLNYFFTQRLVIHWRTWLNDHLLEQWMGDRAYYRSLHLANTTDNPDQRIQQDVTSFVATSLTLAMGVISAIVSVFAFTLMLWGLSGRLGLFGMEIPRAMVFVVYAYVLIATVFAVRIGRPLVQLNFLAEKLAADYRYALIRIREYAENIAFYAGEKVESVLLHRRFGGIIGNVWQIVYRSLKFQGFNLVASQTAVVFPFLIQAPRFFARQITLGDMMQTAQAFGSLQDNLSFFRQAYDDFAGYRANLNRLSGFGDTIAQAHALPRPNRVCEQGRLALADMSIQTPDARTLVSGLSFALQPGEALLIQGPSGAGKTTLLRAFAGLWPFCSGQVSAPREGVLFLSQRPYLPLGSLRDALAYPDTRGDLRDPRLTDILAQVNLAHLLPRLDEIADWGRILSLGEQQRLAFGRLLWARPTVAFLDEATSAMDEGLEFAMYRLLREQLPTCIVVSVGHRSTLQSHHTRRLELSGTGAWSMEALAG